MGHSQVVQWRRKAFLVVLQDMVQRYMTEMDISVKTDEYDGVHGRHGYRERYEGEKILDMAQERIIY